MRFEELSKDPEFPLFKYRMTSDGEVWLHAALQALDRDYVQLRITDADFDDPDKEWEPLPLEREDPQSTNG